MMFVIFSDNDVSNKIIVGKSGICTITAAASLFIKRYCPDSLVGTVQILWLVLSRFFGCSFSDSFVAAASLFIKSI
jgi:hypothetical protein